MDLRSIVRRFSVEQLREAIRYSRIQGKRDKLEREAESLRKQLAKVERNLEGLGGNGTPVPGPKTGRRGRRKGFKVSPATREKMHLAALRRHRGNGKADVPKVGRKKRKPFSAQTRARMAAAQKARWAKLKGTAEPKAATE